MNNSTTNGQLFETLPLPDWLPDETLFSLVSRLHAMSGHQLARHTSKCLFGSYTAGSHHDFPNSLGEFERRTECLLGTAQTIAHERTLLKYYRSFITSSDSASIAETMEGCSVAHLKFRLGLITSRFRANHPLKACPGCMADDKAQHGWPYWHLEHQFPGVWWCHNHNLPLCESLLKSTGVGRFLWHLPIQNEMRQWITEEFGFSDANTAAINSLSQTAKSVVDSGANTPWDTDQFWSIYRKELANRGWVNGKNLRYSDMVSEFLIYSAKLRLIPELSTLPTTVDAAKAQLGRLFRQPRSGTHPLRHIILIDWLFGGINGFLDCLNSSNTLNVKDSNLPHNQNMPDKNHDDSRTKILIKLLTEQGLSMRAAASEVGVDISTAMTWATKAGIPISRRPKILKEHILNDLTLILRKGTNKEKVASQFGISIPTVNRVIRTTPGLQHDWQIARFALAKRNARKTWKSIISTHSHLGTKLLRSLEPATYAWLYRNDRDWLKAHSPSAKLLTDNNKKSQTIWDKRDIILSTEVQRTTLELTKANHLTPIRLWQLYQLIPELKAKLDVLDRLPLTKRAIEQALKRKDPPRSFNRRRFQVITAIQLRSKQINSLPHKQFIR